jgi:RNA polymerase sigma-70 factor, ECF subfamily
MWLKKRKRRAQPSDNELIARVAKKDREALAALYERHARVAYSLAYNMMRGREAAEDLVQDAFVELWRTAGNYHPERGSVRNWILSIVHNRGVDRLRNLAVGRRARRRLASETFSFGADDAYESAWNGIVRRHVNEALESLPPEQFEVLRLAYFSGYTQREIAEILAIPLGTVKGRMRLALRKLRKHLEDREMLGG